MPDLLQQFVLRNWLAADSTVQAVWSLKDVAFNSMVAVETKWEEMLRALPLSEKDNMHKRRYRCQDYQSIINLC